mgnify:CR=1 FL=1
MEFHRKHSVCFLLLGMLFCTAGCTATEQDSTAEKPKKMTDLPPLVTEISTEDTTAEISTETTLVTEEAELPEPVYQAKVTAWELPEELGLQCLKELISVEKDWVPHTEGASLYIRPFIFAVDPFLGVHPGEHYLFMIILSPSGPYYASGLDPVNIYVENKYVRTVRGGMGYAKTGGNYAASLHSQADAYEQGYSQVLWLDGVEQKYIEEVGAMNIAFVIDGEVVTPSLETGSILSGITRKSALELCRSKGIPVSERRITIQEIADAYDAGKLSEVFGTGTAAVISPVGHLKWGDKVMTINNNKIGPVSQMIYDTLTGIQWGKIPDEFGWIVPID